jgi:hypothetical protein
MVELCTDTRVINAKLQTGKRDLKTADWEKSMKEAKVRIGL